MIHTLDFIFDPRWDEKAREKLLAWLDTPDGEPAEVGAFRLERLPGTETARISLWDQTYPFRWKCPEYQCPAGELAGLIRAVRREKKSGEGPV